MDNSAPLVGIGFILMAGIAGFLFCDTLDYQAISEQSKADNYYSLESREGDYYNFCGKIYPDGTVIDSECKIFERGEE